MEHRWGQRIELRMAVTARTGRTLVTARTRNISLSGAWLETALAEVWPAACLVRLELPHAGLLTRRVWTYVVRRTDEGLGVEWAGFAPRVIQLLVLSNIDVQAKRAVPSYENLRLGPLKTSHWPQRNPTYFRRNHE